MLRRSICFGVIFMLFVSLVLSGCGQQQGTESQQQSTGSQAQNNTTAGTEKQEELESVKLIHYVASNPQPDAQIVNDELNKKLKDKINAEVELRVIGWAEHEQKMAVVIAASEEFDAAFASATRVDFFGNAAKGAFLPLDELMAKYMPETRASLPDNIWESAKVGGKIYGVINQQIMVRQSAVSILKSAADKYKFDPNSVKKLEDLEPFFEAIKANEPDSSEMIGFKYPFSYLAPYLGWVDVGNFDIPGVLKNGSSALTVFNQYESPEFLSTVQLMKKWYDKGYFPKDVLTKTKDKNKTYAGFSGTYKPGIEAEEAISVYNNREIYVVPIGPSLLNTGFVMGTVTAISSTSKNPERTAMYLELMNNDKDIYNTACYGIEGKHYNKVGPERIEPIKDSGYFPGISWEFGNQFNAYILPTQPDDVWEKTKALNANTTPAPILGFTFDIGLVKTEVANCKAVVNEYLEPFAHGVFPDVDAKVAEFNAKLKQAGMDKVIAEKQSQLDKWLAAAKR